MRHDGSSSKRVFAFLHCVFSLFSWQYLSVHFIPGMSFIAWMSLGEMAVLVLCDSYFPHCCEIQESSFKTSYSCVLISPVSLQSSLIVC